MMKMLIVLIAALMVLSSCTKSSTVEPVEQYEDVIHGEGNIMVTYQFDGEVKEVDAKYGNLTLVFFNNENGGFKTQNHYDGWQYKMMCDEGDSLYLTTQNSFDCKLSIYKDGELWKETLDNDTCKWLRLNGVL